MADCKEEELKQIGRKAANFIRGADYLLILAGAGMGVDSGLGTFRGKGALVWPPFEKGIISYDNISHPHRFQDDDQYGGSKFAWSFWKTCIESYTRAEPHQGYHILAQWTQILEKKFSQSLSKIPPRSSSPSVLLSADGEELLPKKPKRAVQVVTSNIDGHFLRLEEFQDHVFEVHGCCLFLQCAANLHSVSPPCSYAKKWWETPIQKITNLPIDPETLQVTDSNELPICPGTCGKAARPLVLLFGNDEETWLSSRADQQELAVFNWMEAIFRGLENESEQEEMGEERKDEDPHLPKGEKQNPPKVVAIEIGAGTAVPTIRIKGEEFCGRVKCPLIRINPVDLNPPKDPNIESLCLPLPAMKALLLLDELIKEEGGFLA